MSRILFLDDDRDLAALLERALRKAGHSLAAFATADEALAAFAAAPGEFDLVLTDMSMPGMNGIEFALEVLRIRPGTDVVIATGCEDPNWAAHARRSGVRAVIEKPLSVSGLASLVVGFLTAGPRELR